MTTGDAIFWVFLAFLLAAAASVIVLQIALSKKESKWFGLVLPMIYFVFLVLMAFIEGPPIERVIMRIQSDPSYFIRGMTFFAMFNIPTAILLAIYTICRRKLKKQRALEKMNVQDLA